MIDYLVWVFLVYLVFVAGCVWSILASWHTYDAEMSIVDICRQHGLSPQETEAYRVQFIAMVRQHRREGISEWT